MSTIVISRTMRICVLCKHWNGAIGSTTIRPQIGAHSFQIDNREQHPCFKPGVGIEKMAIQNCPHFKPRYED